MHQLWQKVHVNGFWSFKMNRQALLVVLCDVVEVFQ